MNTIPENLESLDKSKEIIVQCKSGKRSNKCLVDTPNIGQSSVHNKPIS